MPRKPQWKKDSELAPRSKTFEGSPFSWLYVTAYPNTPEGLAALEETVGLEYDEEPTRTDEVGDALILYRSSGQVAEPSAQPPEAPLPPVEREPGDELPSILEQRETEPKEHDPAYFRHAITKAANEHVDSAIEGGGDQGEALLEGNKEEVEGASLNDVDKPPEKEPEEPLKLPEKYLLGTVIVLNHYVDKMVTDYGKKHLVILGLEFQEGEKPKKLKFEFDEEEYQRFLKQVNVSDLYPSLVIRVAFFTIAGERISDYAGQKEPVPVDNSSLAERTQQLTLDAPTSGTVAAHAAGDIDLSTPSEPLEHFD